MSKVCEITAKAPKVGNNVSHAQNKTKTRQMPNLQTRTYESVVLAKSFRVKLTVNAMRTVDKYGTFDNFLANYKKHKAFSAPLAKARKALKAKQAEA